MTTNEEFQKEMMMLREMKRRAEAGFPGAQEWLDQYNYQRKVANEASARLQRELSEKEKAQRQAISEAKAQQFNADVSKELQNVRYGALVKELENKKAQAVEAVKSLDRKRYAQLEAEIREMGLQIRAMEMGVSGQPADDVALKLEYQKLAQTQHTITPSEQRTARQRMNEIEARLRKTPVKITIYKD